MEGKTEKGGGTVSYIFVITCKRVRRRTIVKIVSSTSLVPCIPSQNALLLTFEYVTVNIHTT
jgi:hypothetical protein